MLVCTGLDMGLKRLPSQNHGICHICALKLVKAEHVALLSNLSRDIWHSVNVVSMLHLDAVQPLVHILHEVVEVDAGFRFHRCGQGLIKQVHQHGLAASDIAVQIQASRKVVGDISNGGFAWALAEERREHRLLGCGLERFDARVLDGRGVIIAQFPMEILKILNDAFY